METIVLQSWANLRTMPSRRLVSESLDMLNYAKETRLGNVAGTVRSVLPTVSPLTFPAWKVIERERAAIRDPRNLTTARWCALGP